MQIISPIPTDSTIIVNKLLKVSMDRSVYMSTITMTKVDRCCPHEVNEKLAERIIHRFALYFISCLEKR
jgi:hypothetical protein